MLCRYAVVAPGRFLKGAVRTAVPLHEPVYVVGDRYGVLPGLCALPLGAHRLCLNFGLILASLQAFNPSVCRAPRALLRGIVVGIDGLGFLPSFRDRLAVFVVADHSHIREGGTPRAPSYRLAPIDSEPCRIEVYAPAAVHLGYLHPDSCRDNIVTTP